MRGRLTRAVCADETSSFCVADENLARRSLGYMCAVPLWLGTISHAGLLNSIILGQRSFVVSSEVDDGDG